MQRVEKRGSLKRWLGHPLFISAGFTTWLTGYDRHTPHFRLSGDGGPPVDDGYFSIVLNTNPYTYLGNRPLDLSPAATLDQPLVAITFTTMSATAILSSLAGALRGGGVKPARHLDIRESVRDLVIEHDTPFPYQVDGDALGDTRRLEFDYVPEAVGLVFPHAADRLNGCVLGSDRLTPSSPGDRSPASVTRQWGRSAGATVCRPRARRAIAGTSVHTPSTPRSASSTSRVGVVRGPHVDEQPGSMASLDERSGDDALPWMDGGMPRGRDPLDARLVERHAEEGGGDVGRVRPTGADRGPRERRDQPAA